MFGFTKKLDVPPTVINWLKNWFSGLSYSVAGELVTKGAGGKGGKGESEAKQPAKNLDEVFKKAVAGLGLHDESAFKLAKIALKEELPGVCEEFEARYNSLASDHQRNRLRQMMVLCEKEESRVKILRYLGECSEEQFEATMEMVQINSWVEFQKAWAWVKREFPGWLVDSTSSVFEWIRESDSEVAKTIQKKTAELRAKDGVPTGTSAGLKDSTMLIESKEPIASTSDDHDGFNGFFEYKEPDEPSSDAGSEIGKNPARRMDKQPPFWRRNIVPIVLACALFLVVFGQVMYAVG